MLTIDDYKKLLKKWLLYAKKTDEQWKELLATLTNASEENGLPFIDEEIIGPIMTCEKCEDIYYMKEGCKCL